MEECVGRGSSDGMSSKRDREKATFLRDSQAAVKGNRKNCKRDPFSHSSARNSNHLSLSSSRDLIPLPPSPPVPCTSRSPPLAAASDASTGGPLCRERERERERLVLQPLLVTRRLLSCCFRHSVRCCGSRLIRDPPTGCSLSLS